MTEMAGGSRLTPEEIWRLNLSTAIIAGPGTGKTELLARRATHLLTQGECPAPRRILAICFKTDACANLKSRVRLRCGGTHSGRFTSMTFHAFAKSLIDRFRSALPESIRPTQHYKILPKKAVHPASITFDQMVPLARRILQEAPQLKRALRMTYTHIFLDEFQDCTQSQYDLVKDLFFNTDAVLTAVGDPNQAIMGFASAVTGIFKTYLEDFEAEKFGLYVNHRSAPLIQKVQAAVGLSMDPDSPLDLTEEAVGGEVIVHEYKDSSDEATELSKKIARLITDDGVIPAQIAVLVRQRGLVERFKEALKQAGLCYRDETEELQNLLHEPLPLLILDWLKCISTPNYASAMRGLLVCLQEIFGFADEDDPLESVMIRQLSAQRRKFRKKFEQSDEAPEALVEMTTWLIDDLLGVDRIMARWPQYSQGTWLRECQEKVNQAVAEARDRTESWQETFDLLQGESAIRILTIHKCKGLEFDTAVVLGVDDQTYFGPCAEQCFFVAISRAKKRLWITFADSRSEIESRQRRTRCGETSGFYTCLSNLRIPTIRQFA